MIEILITVGLIMLIIGIICLFTDTSGFSSFILGVIGAYVLSGGIMAGCQESREPTAMDVYKGKTTLEITYKDGVPVDSIVVFKGNKK